MRLTKRKRDGIWLCEYTEPDTGKRKRVSTGSRDRAEAERQSHMILAGQGPKAPGYTLNEALETAWKRRWKDQKGAKTFSYVVAAVKADLGKLQCRDITFLVLDTYAQQLTDKGLKPATINHRIGAVSVALDLAAKANRIQAVPPIPRLSTRGNARLRFVTREEEKALLDEAFHGGHPRAIRRLVIVLIDTGCRLSEITSASDASIVGSNLRIEDSKNGKPRAVPLTKRAQVELRGLLVDPQWQEITRGAATSAVRKRSAKDWSVKQFTKVRNAAGLPDVSLHILRHTCASRLVEAGVDLYRVKEWLGHSTIQMTERYAHLKPDALADVVSVLEQNPAAQVRHLKAV